MKTNLILLFFGLMFFTNFSAQINTPLQNQGKLNLGLNGLGFSYELPVGQKWVWENTAGIGGGYSIRVNSTGTNTDYYYEINNPVPFLITEFKYIYNRAKREEKGKSLLNNSGNYVGIQLKYSFGRSDDLYLNPALLSEVHWGFQTPMGKRFLFDFHIGLGYINDFSTHSGSFLPTLGAQFSYVLFK